MRIFGETQLMNVETGFKENDSIDHPWINKAMERAQKLKVETLILEKR